MCQCVCLWGYVGGGNDRPERMSCTSNRDHTECKGETMWVCFSFISCCPVCLSFHSPSGMRQTLWKSENVFLKKEHEDNLQSWEILTSSYTFHLLNVLIRHRRTITGHRIATFLGFSIQINESSISWKSQLLLAYWAK